MILQALPYTEQYQIDGVLDRLSLIDQTTDELFTGSCDEILKKIETALNSPSKVLESGIPEFYCGCSIEKIKQVVVSLGPEEAFGIIDEIGYIEFICEFCKEKYLLDAEEVRLLFL
jgi:molecular chaperone Hsp33